MLTNEIKETFLRYYSERGCQICSSFPITLVDDPTLLFVNATIAPLKYLYLRNNIFSMERYALVQRCLRLGGASELKNVGVNPSCHTFFEMMGASMFRMDLKEAISDFLGFLKIVGLNFKNLFFIVPERSERFKESLQKCNVSADRILGIRENGLFWQYWQFGIPGPAGYGMTVIFSPLEHDSVDMGYIMNNINNFLEFANVIYVTGFVDKNEHKTSLICPGFDIGIGVERLAAILQNCNNYEIDNIKPLMRVVVKFLRDSGVKKNFLFQETVRIITDHLRAACVLISEGVEPANKMHGYVLRKLIRRTLTKIWLLSEKDILIRDLVFEFSLTAEKVGLNGVLQSQELIEQIIERESLSFSKAIRRGIQVLQSNQEMDLDYLRDTFGLPKELAEFIKKRKERGLVKCQH